MGSADIDDIGPDPYYDQSGYKCSPEDLDDDRLRQAEFLVGQYWDRDWKLLSHNCQDHARAVLVADDFLKEQEHRSAPEGGNW